MNILVIGSGAREHAVIKKLKECKGVAKIYACPGNGGICFDATCVDISACDLSAICSFAKENNIDYAVVTPDDPLSLGLVDELQKIGVPAFGPTKAAAQIEASKVFSKNLMKKYHIPTAAFEVFTDAKNAIDYLKSASYPIVVKADGLALGKGVIIANSFLEGEKAVQSMMIDGVFGSSGKSVVIEEFMEGVEVSALTFTDGKTIVPMVSSMDHKRALDGDKGLNTGGMGSIAPSPFYTESVAKECMENIFIPTIRAMECEGAPFCGCLYFGLMLTKNGVKVVEFNCRFGDPETQCVLPLLNSDLLEIMQATTNGTLDKVSVEFSKEACACLVLASKGYPVSYEKGFEITYPSDALNDICFAGVKSVDGKLLTNGGRVLSVVKRASSLKNAIDACYLQAETIHFDNAFYRRDIGKTALEVKS